MDHYALGCNTKYALSHSLGDVALAFKNGTEFKLFLSHKPIVGGFTEQYIHVTKCLPRAQVEHQPNSVGIKKTTENSYLFYFLQLSILVIPYLWSVS